MSERIAILSTSYPAHVGDAAGHFVESEARALAARGNRVTVIAAGRESRAYDAGRGLRVIRLFDGGATGWPGLSARLREKPLRALGLGLWIARARSALEQSGPFERVIAHWLVPAGYPILATARLGSAALEIVVHGSDARLVARWPAPLRSALFRSLSRRSVRLRCVSNQLAETIERAALGSVRPTIDVAPPSLDVGRVKSRLEARAELGMSQDARVAVVAGRLISEKRVDCALRAAGLIGELQVFVIGDGRELQALRQAFPEVRFLGRLSRPETLTYIAAADAVLSASRAEGAPSVVREARALGVPVVACNAGDLSLWAASDLGLFAVP